MNFLKKIMGSNQKDDLVVIPSGQLILSRSPSSPKSESECLYNDAVATIRPSSNPFNYQLVIQKAYQEGEEQLKDDGETDDSLLEELESGDERVFLIHEDLNFHKYINTEGNTTIVWTDVSGDDGDKFAFVCDISTEEDLIERFLKTLRKCEYERKYKKPFIGATDAQLQEFNYDPSKEIISKEILRNTELLGSSEESVTSDDDEDEDQFKDAESGTPAKTNTYDGIKFKQKIIEGDELVVKQAELHLFDPQETAFVMKNKATNVKVVDVGKWQYWLVIESNDSKKVLLSTIIDQNISPTFNYDHLCFIFNYIVNEEDATSWLLKFEDFNELNDFQTGFMQALWESLNKTKWGVSKDQDYVLDAFNNLNLQDEELESSETEDEEEEEPRSSITRGKTTISYNDDEDQEAFNKFKLVSGKNKALAVSYKNDRSYVIRGNNIGVFKATDDGEKLKLDTSIGGIKNTRGAKFNPEKFMLHEQDGSLILQDPNNLNNLYRMDLNRGLVVDEYKVGKADEDINVLEFNPTKKFSQLTDEKTFLGLSTNGLFKIDPRLSGNNLVDSEYKKYLTKTNFSAITTNALGNIAVAGKDGEIKLFDRLGINAKTRLPGLGEEIKGLDVSADGKWILATCSTYLLLVDVRIKEGKNAGNTGFLKSFAKDSKPIPKILQLLPQHVALIRQQTRKPINFTVARLNTGLDSKETTIISSSGPYVIRWSLRKIVKGDQEPYLIKRYNLEVTDDNFKFGSDKDAIISTKDEVALVNKKTFKKPTRESFARKH